MESGKQMSEVTAYHFFGDTLRGGLPVPKDGEWLSVEGDLGIGRWGLHAGFEPFDAFIFATGSNFALVKMREVAQIRDGRIMVARSRQIVRRLNPMEFVREFVRLCVVDLFDRDPPLTIDPEVVALVRADRCAELNVVKPVGVTLAASSAFEYVDAVRAREILRYLYLLYTWRRGRVDLAGMVMAKTVYYKVNYLFRRESTFEASARRRFNRMAREALYLTTEHMTGGDHESNH